MDAGTNVGGIITEYLNRIQESDKPFTPSTKKGYFSDLKLFLNVAKIGYLSLPDALKNVEEKDVKKYLSLGNVSPRTQRRRWSSLSGFLEYCAFEGITSDYPQNMELPETGDGAQSFITTDEFNTLMESGPLNPGHNASVLSHRKDLSIMSTIFLEGLRIGEILEKSYEWMANAGFSEPTKKRMEAYENVYFDVFVERLSLRPSQIYYRNNHRKPISDRSVRRNLSKTGKRVLGRGDVTPRSLRNGYLKNRIDALRAGNPKITNHQIRKVLDIDFPTIRGLSR